MSAAEKPKPEQIQANVAAALSRLRGELGASNTPAMAPKPAMEAPEPKLGPVVSLPVGPMRPAETARPVEDVRGSAANRPFEPTLGSPLGGAPMETAAPAPSDNERPMTEAARPLEFLSGRRLDAARVEPTFTPERAATEQPDLLSGMEVPPAPPPPLGALDEDLEANELRRKRRNRILASVVVLVIVVGAGWAFLRNRTVEGPPPVITADTSPEKVKPAEEGGMQVPNQNVQILDNLASGQSAATTNSEGNATVLPPPEQPVAPPAAEQNVQPGSAPSAPAVTETPPAAPATASSSAAQPTTDQSQTDQAQESGQAAPADGVPSVAAPAIPSVAAPAVPNATTNATASTTPIPQAAAPEPTTTATAPAKPAATPTASAATQTAAAAATAPITTPKTIPGASAKVQLAAVKSEAAARAQWLKLQKAHPDLLGALTLNIQKVDKAGVAYYRIQAGPLTDKAKAKQLCSKLAAVKQDCIVAR